MGRTMAYRWVALLTLCMATWSGGCVSNADLQPRAQFYFDDIPVPAGFEQERRRSTHSMGPDRRAKHYYVGRGTPLQVSNFYRSRMPKFQWELEDDKAIVLKNGVDYLNYRKGKETCEIRIEESTNSLFGPKTQVVVDLQSGS